GLMMERAELPSLRWLVTGADRVRRVDGNRRYGLANTYGPTEVTVLAASAEVRLGADIDIGRPLWNKRVYVLDEHGQLLPEGVVGEMHVTGIGVARGYMGR